MPVCPNQHESHTPDFCEVCGVEIPPEAGGGATAERVGGEPQICPACHAEHDLSSGDFCEICGYNFRTGVSPAPAAPATVEAVPPLPPQEPASPLRPVWELVVTVAPNPHAGMPDSETPPAFAERIYPLDADTLLIGRRSVRRQLLPDIPLDHDDGVSHRHAQLTRTLEGDFALADLGSSNGTTLNGADVPPGPVVPLAEGDRVALGRWTNLTLRRKKPPESGNLTPPPEPTASA